MLSVKGLELETLTKKLDKNGDPVDDLYSITLAKYRSHACKLIFDVYEEDINKYLEMDYANLSLVCHKCGDAYE